MKAYHPSTEEIIAAAEQSAQDVLHDYGSMIDTRVVRTMIETAFLRGWNAKTRVTTEWMLEYHALFEEAKK